MRKQMMFRLMTMIMIAVFCLPAIGAAAAPEPFEGFRPLSDIDVWIDALDWHTYYYSDCEKGGRIYGDFSVTSGSDIDFCICDRSTYNAWVSGDTVSVYNLNENVGSLDFSFNVPEDGIWHIVFRNDALLTRKHIVGEVFYSSPVTTSSYSAVVALIAVGGFLALIAVGFKACSDSGKKNAASAPHRLSTYPPPASYHPQPETASRYCPRCGTPRQSPTAMFCAQCGMRFGDPPGLE